MRNISVARFDPGTVVVAGRGAIRFYLPLDVQLPNDFFSQLVIVAKDVFVAILGILALIGMIERNAVILIEQNRDGKGRWARMCGTPSSRHRCHVFAPSC
jgi:hypothetical protein